MISIYYVIWLVCYENTTEESGKSTSHTHNLYEYEIGTHKTASIWWYLIPFFVDSVS